ncbi:E3 ubiquitin-protein ligase Topors [Adelges cooleyi]|uniref:E3 ubiquitin-protein ligase Topors n=1 Tax=Adelges cooleyi TaxID=133065 RepID=UPI00218046B5|nr:E3 ubiquitin-protein ligase Topors [Adelges cooleyi]XP_050423847.1 E3 ubiquitin-protein ligase Topors [Adelges cooleyi]
MSLNIKTELFNESSSVPVVNLSDSSDDEIPATKTENININEKVERPRTPETHCSICLEELTNRCYSDSCWHMFCFECLKRWSSIESSCPLCKKSFKIINHTFNDEGLHETYEVPVQPDSLYNPQRIFLRPFPEVNRFFRMDFFLNFVRRNERYISVSDNSDYMVQIPIPQEPLYGPEGRRIPHQSIAHLARVRVYSENLWAEPLPDLSGRFRDCSSAFYRNNPAQMHRLASFILRDISAIREVERSDNPRSDSTSNDFLTNTIMQTILNYEIRDTYMTAMLRPYLGEHSTHFCHELHNYASSPYDMIGYDRNVNYNNRPLFTSQPQAGVNVTTNNPLPIISNLPPWIRLPQLSDTIVVDSDSDSDSIRMHTQEVIVVSSTSDDSEVEMLNHPFRPVDTYDLSTRDQPSTSTGIRDSLDRPTTRYNLRRRRLFSPALSDSSGCPVHMSQIGRSSTSRRGRIIIDSSSSDDEALPTTHDNSRAMRMKAEIVYGERKRKLKKNKQKKRKRNVDNHRTPRICYGSRRARPFSSASSLSSSSDSDERGDNFVGS